MHRNDHHLTDRELLLLLDRELSSQEQRRAEEHVLVCDTCRHRRQHFMHVSAAVNQRVHAAVDSDSNDDSDAIRQSRARLVARLSEAARDERQPVVARVLGNRPWLAGPAAVLAAAAAIVLVMRVAGPAPSRGQGDSAVLHDAALPIAAFTPGATWTVAADELCAAANRERLDIPAAVRDVVLRNYRMTSVSADDYELDYLITPELGGAPDARNLWPQRYASGIWNAHVKDQLEDLLPAMVCEGKVPLQTAQHDIAVNWIAAYKRYFRTSVPLPTNRAAANLRSWRNGPDSLAGSIWQPAGTPSLRLVAVTTGR